MANMWLTDIPGTNSYLDISDESGYAHIYKYDVAGSKGKGLTSGNWEVTSILAVDAKNGLVYFQGNERSSMELHIYSVGLDGRGKRALVDDKKEGIWSASFSKGNSYYLLSVSATVL